MEFEMTAKIIEIGGWKISVGESNQYVDICRIDKPGGIQIKADDEGFVADIYGDDKESVVSTYAVYGELKGDDSE
jgi:hypothetical protein